jgi:ADP-heptose:LPS heptosyltransferase/SAM-dependent methyltransferase
MRRLILRSFQSPGDILMLTAAVRDLHAACPGQFQTDVRTSADGLWLNNPYLTRLHEGEPGVEILDMHYPLIHQSNQRPYHFIHGYVQYLEEKLNVRIPLTRFQGDIHLSEEELRPPEAALSAGLCEGFWIIVAGGKYDFTAKWWNPESFQKVVDHFRAGEEANGHDTEKRESGDSRRTPKIQFVQCGEEGHWHPRLKNVVDLVGKTSLRDFVRLMHHAAGVVCPVTFAMHLAAAVPVKTGRRGRACVVIAGGREPAHWEAYPGHQFLSTVGTLPCCADGGCWKSRCQPVGDGDPKDRHDLCERPVQIRADLRIPQCMEMITPEDVIRRIELYYQGGLLSQDDSKPLVAPAPPNGRPTIIVGQDANPAAKRQERNPNLHGEPYYQERKRAGLDYLAYGDWQRDYGRWLVQSLGWHGKRVLDVGCACGAILRGLTEAGALVQGVDINEYMIALGREQWPALADKLFVCDAVNLHPFPDAAFDAVHAAQAAGEWKPDLVPHILQELARVTASRGVLFWCLDRHANPQPMSWWQEQLERTGWQPCSGDFEPALRRDPDSFLNRYQWDWLLAGRT